MQKQYLFTILNLITLPAHIYAMEKELLTCPHNVLDHITPLPYNNPEYETNKEFIKRTRSLKTRTVPEKYIHDHLDASNIKHVAYSSNNARIIVSEKSQHSELNSTMVMPKLLIINRDLQRPMECCIGRTHQSLAISRNGIYFATLYPDTIFDVSTKRIVNAYALVITNIYLDNNGNNSPLSYDIPSSLELCDKCPTIAFNKQDTHIIVHGKHGQYKIFPVPNITQNQNNDLSAQIIKNKSDKMAQSIIDDILSLVSFKQLDIIQQVLNYLNLDD